MLRIKFAKANLAFSWIASSRVNRDIRDEIWVFEFLFGLVLRRFSQSKFHFDFEDDSATGTASHSLLVPFFAKNSRLGYFLTQITGDKFFVFCLHFELERLNCRNKIGIIFSLINSIIKRSKFSKQLNKFENKISSSHCLIWSKNVLQFKNCNEINLN